MAVLGDDELIAVMLATEWVDDSDVGNCNEEQHYALSSHPRPFYLVEHAGDVGYRMQTIIHEKSGTYSDSVSVSPQRLAAPRAPGALLGLARLVSTRFRECTKEASWHLQGTSWWVDRHDLSSDAVAANWMLYVSLGSSNADPISRGYFWWRGRVVS